MVDEAKIAEHYRRYHELARPKTDIWYLLKGLFVLGVFSLLFSSSVVAVLADMKIIEWEKFSFNDFCNILIPVVVVLFILMAKQAMIVCIELYQHYASEETRRKCVCMPSCSTYALMVLRKNNIFKATYLILCRLKSCAGQICFIDYPE